jgi:hypothetical protein
VDLLANILGLNDMDLTIVLANACSSVCSIPEDILENSSIMRFNGRINLVYKGDIYIVALHNINITTLPIFVYSRSTKRRIPNRYLVAEIRKHKITTLLNMGNNLE